MSNVNRVTFSNFIGPAHKVVIGVSGQCKALLPCTQKSVSEIVLLFDSGFYLSAAFAQAFQCAE